jgi:hypothetical protein
MLVNAATTHVRTVRQSSGHDFSSFVRNSKTLKFVLTGGGDSDEAVFAT